LNDPTGAPIQNDALWEITFGASGTGDPNTLYFAAGVNHEKGGLFGAITAAAAPAKGDFTMNVEQSALTVKQGGSAAVQVDVLPANGFASQVNFTVSGLPAGATFQFTPNSVTPTAGATVSTTLNITTGTSATPPTNPYSVSHLRRGPGNGVLAAGSLFPLGLMVLVPALRKRRRSAKAVALGGSAMFALLLAIFVSGCGGTKGTSTNPQPTPTGTSMITVTATSGSLTHTTNLTLTVQ
jgi:hypothetical protein